LTLSIIIVTFRGLRIAAQFDPLRKTTSATPSDFDHQGAVAVV